MKNCLIFLALLFASSAAVAQQNSPVAGQAATLTDLLKKDYSSIDPDLRGDEIVKDRALAISIFKSFLMPRYGKPFKDSVKLSKALKAAGDKYITYSQAKRAVAQFSGASTNSDDAKGINDANAKNNKASDVAKTSYYAAQQAADSLQFIALKTYYTQDSNKFLTDVIEAFKKKYDALINNKMDLAATANANTSIQKSLPLLGGSLDVSTTAIIDGISKFLANRIKEELVTYAVQNIQQYIHNHEKTVPIEQLLVLLPSTASYLEHFDADKLTSFPTELKQYIQNDMDHLVDNAYNLKNTTYFKGKLVANPNLELAFDAIPLVGKINQVKYPGDYFNILSSSQLVADLQARPNDINANNIATFVALLEMLSNSLTVTTNGEPAYTTVDFWKTYGKEVSFMKLFIGFLYQQDIKYYKIAIKKDNNTVNDIVIAKLLSTVMTDDTATEKMFNTAAPIFTSICKSSESIYQQAQAIKKLNNAGQAIGADTVYNFTKSIIDFSADLGRDADTLIAVFANSTASNLHISAKMQPFLVVAATCNDAVRDIRNKKYADGILQLVNLGAKISPGLLGQVPEYLNLYSFSTMRVGAWADWQTAVSLETGNLAVPAPLATSAVNVSTELISINNFYIHQPAGYDASLSRAIGFVSGKLGALHAGGILDTASANKLKTLLGNVKFGRLVVSYYAGFMMDQAAADIAPKMVAMLVNGHHVFTQQDADNFVADITTYVDAVFTAKILQTNPDLSTMNNAENAIAGLVKNYVLNLPNSFGWQIDPVAINIVNFVNDMAQAKTSDDVEKAIEAFALSSGSYSVKQKSSFTVGINSYPGILPAWEVGGGNGVKNSFSTGFTAPLGIDVSWGNVCGQNDFGFFIPIIDVGAVTQVRLGDNTNTTALPQLSWSNFLSPGLFATFGLHDTPFSFNLGVQYGPNIQNTNLTSTGSSTYRVGLGITIDIPIFNFYTKPVPSK